MLNDSQFLRYQRQVALTNIGEVGQKNLNQAHILMIGCGGLGSAASLYLAGAGIGKLVIVDNDDLDVSNLHRQVIYRYDDLQQPKVEAMTKQLKALNAEVNVRAIQHRLSSEQLQLEVMLADIVLDCSDNMQTRQQVNQACFQQQTPLISAAAIGWQGQFAVFDFSTLETEVAEDSVSNSNHSGNQNHRGNQNNGCYHCLYPFQELAQVGSCQSHGIVGPVVGILGNYQALTAIQKIVTGSFQCKTHQLHIFDGLNLQWQQLDIVADSHCLVCGETISTESASKDKELAKQGKLI